MAIKSRTPWPFQLLYTAAIIGLAMLLAFQTYEIGRELTGHNPRATRDRINDLQTEVDRLRAERDSFATTINAAESQLNIELSAQRQLVTQVKALEVENTKLKEDLAFFDSLLPADVKTQGIAIRRLTAEMIAPDQLRYRLLVMQGAKANRDFVGDLQLMLTHEHDGNDAMIVFPDSKTENVDKFKLAFRHYQRIEGVLTLPEGVSIKAVQARILERGQVRTQQSATL